MTTYELKDGFVLRNNGQPLGKIVARVSGYADGTWWYQIAAKPYDEPAVMGLENQRVAFLDCIAELNRRAKAA